MQSGLSATVAAFLIWGLFPIYWKWLDHVPAMQLMSHRLVWCCVLVAGWLTLRQGARWWRPLLGQPRLRGLLSISATLIALNWWLYIWAVNSGHIVETSLGYFINPLVNVVLGVVLLGERLNRRQWVAVALAAAGVGWMTWRLGEWPWIALGLAFSFGFYGLIRKVAEVDAMPGLGFESTLLLPVALGVLLWVEWSGDGAFAHVNIGTDLLLIGAGPVTALPLVLFAFGARRIPYSLVGFLQYLAPTLQLACGVFLFDEPFSRVQLIGFSMIWAALALYAADGAVRWTRVRRS